MSEYPSTLLCSNYAALHGGVMSSVATSLPENMLDQLDVASDAPALLEREIRQRIQQLSRAVEGDPFANSKLLAALELSRRTDQGGLTLADLAALVARLSHRCFLDRAVRLRAYLGDLDQQASERIIREIVTAMAAGGDAGFEEFKRLVSSPVFGIVLTAHPTFTMSEQTGQALAALAAGDVESGSTMRPGEFTLMPPSDLSLATEHQWSLAVLDHVQSALDRATAVAIEVARDLYPQRWLELEPCLVTVASWVGYDLDGRSDIAWFTTIGKRLVVKLGQIRRMRANIARLIEADAAIRESLAQSDAALATAEESVGLQIEALGQLPDAGSIESVSRIFLATRLACLTSTSALRAGFTHALECAEVEDVRRGLAVLRASAKSHGLSLAHTHVRLNASQLHNAIRRLVGMETTPTDPAHRRRYVTAINDLLSRIQPETINFALLDAEPASAKRLFMIVQQIVKYVDAETPIRFLIAETEAGFTLLTALYFAKLFDVERQVEISPLFETADAIERGAAILEEALKSKFYKDYVRQTGRLSVQFGFSDSGRYLGQMAATFQIERLRLRLAAMLERQGLTDVQLVLFNTHGESVGRGGHPGSLEDRFKYVAPPVSRARFAESGITIKEEDSFQGGDGFVLLMSRQAALAVIAQAMRCYAGPDTESAEDPIYEAGDYSVEFFATIRRAFGDLAADPNYLALLSAFGSNLAPSSGSRPVARQSDGAITPMRISEVAQLRAIPNNTALQQLGMLANTLHGVGSARMQDPELFDHMMEASPRFRRALGMVEAALVASDPDTLKAYVDLFDPGNWLARSARARSRSRAAELRAVSGHLEQLALGAPLQTLFRRLRRDYLGLIEGQSEAELGPDAGRRETLSLLHVLRISIVQRIFILAMRIPPFSPQRGVTRDGLIAGILSLEVVRVVKQLKIIFPRAAPLGPTAGSEEEPATYTSDATQGYAREHDSIFEPMLRLFELNLRLGNLISFQIGAVG